MKKYIAEIFGTFGLTLVVIASVSTRFFPVPTTILAGVTLGLFVYTVGHISGCHINPAVTIGAWSIRKIKSHEAIAYIICQFVGAGLAMLIAGALLNLGPVAHLAIKDTLAVGLAEMIGTVFFTFGIASVIYGKAPSIMSGIVIGGSLFLGAAIASLLGSSGIVNPAVALGVRSLNWMYLIGPRFGSVIGMNLYQLLESSKL